jgi:hypothetical protein
VGWMRAREADRDWAARESGHRGLRVAGRDGDATAHPASIVVDETARGNRPDGLALDGTASGRHEGLDNII